MMARIPFDTLAYANRLKDAGMEPHVAEAQAAANAEMFSSFFDENLVTKHDLEQTETKLRTEIHQLDTKLSTEIQKLSAEIQQVDTKLSAEIQQIDAKLGTEITALRTELHASFERADLNLKAELKHEISQLRLEMTQEFAKIRHEMKELENRLTVRLGVMIVGSMTLMTAVLSILHIVH